jgi:hypothetical protein
MDTEKTQSGKIYRLRVRDVGRHFAHACEVVAPNGRVVHYRLRVRDVGRHFAHACEVVAPNGRVVHTTAPVPYGMRSAALSCGRRTVRGWA